MNQTSIQITIDAPFEHQSEAENARQQIEFISHLISALFWSMKTNAQACDELDLRNEFALFEFGAFRENVQHLSSIGAGLSDQLTAYALQSGGKDEK